MAKRKGKKNQNISKKKNDKTANKKKSEYSSCIHVLPKYPKLFPQILILIYIWYKKIKNKIKKNKIGPPDPRVRVWVFFSDLDPDPWNLNGSDPDPTGLYF